MLYLQRFLTNFQKHFSRWKERKVAIVVENFKVHRHFRFAMATLQLFQHPKNVKISIFALYTCPGRNAISPEVFNEFSKTFFSLKEEEGGYCGWKFQSAQTFSFCYRNVATFPTSWKCKNFIFCHYTWPGRNTISPEVFNEFSKTFLSLKGEEGRYCRLKISSAQTFSFSNGDVTTLPTSRKCKNFNFSLYTVREEMPYLQRYLTNIQKLFFGWKKRKLAITFENVKCTEIFVFQ